MSLLSLTYKETMNLPIMAEVTPALVKLELEYWFDKYIKPLPTWVLYDIRTYRAARGHIVARAPSPELMKEGTVGYVAGVLEADGCFGYYLLRGVYRIVLHLGMVEADRNIVDYIGKLINVSTEVKVEREGITYRIRPVGLRGYLLINLILPHLIAKRKRDGARYIIEKGAWVTKKELKEFIRLYKPKPKRITVVEEGSLKEEVEVEAWIIEPAKEVW
jgi:hypothetical protein